MDREIESFQPLVTQRNPSDPDAGAGTAAPAGQHQLPSGLGILVRAGASLRKALLVSLALFLISLAELVVLLCYPGPEVAVVWEEKPASPLVEGP